MFDSFSDHVRNNPAILVSNMKASQLRVWIVILLAERPVSREQIKRTLFLSFGLIDQILSMLENAEVIRQTPEGCWVRVRTIELSGV